MFRLRLDTLLPGNHYLRFPLQGGALCSPRRGIPTTGNEDAGLALQHTTAPGSHAAVLPSIVIQPYKHNVNAAPRAQC